MLYAAPYAHIGETQADVTQVPADPRPELKPLVARNLTAAVDLRNTQTDAASQAKRREIFQTTRQAIVGRPEKGEKREARRLRTAEKGP